MHFVQPVTFRGKKSVFAPILFLAVANTGRRVFPGGHPAYALAGGAVGYSISTITAVIVAFLWGAETLARFRYARSGGDA